jgi:MFS family permease
MRGDRAAASAGAPDDALAGPQTPVSTAFIAGFVVAQVGAYVSFLPLLQILAPLKAAALAPASKHELVSQIALLGAVVAASTNLLVGFLSDRTRGRWGRRRPWIVAGAILAAASYALIDLANSPLALLASILAFQFAFNLAFAPLQALIPDLVPDRQKGWVAAMASLGLPLGTVVGSVLVGMVVHDMAGRFVALAVIVLLALVPFALAIRDPLLPTIPPPRLSALRIRWPRFTADFAYVWVGRCLVLTAFSMSQIYLLFYLQETFATHVAKGWTPEAEMARMALVFGVVNAATGIAAGRASDLFSRRKAFVFGGAVVLGGALLGLALAKGWLAVAISYGVLGCGAGCYFAVDLALIAQVLPSASTVGRDLGVINLSNTVPQIAAPAMAAVLLAAPHSSIRWVFALAAVLAILGAGIVLPIRRVR